MPTDAQIASANVNLWQLIAGAVRDADNLHRAAREEQRLGTLTAYQGPAHDCWHAARLNYARAAGELARARAFVPFIHGDPGMTTNARKLINATRRGWKG